MGLLGVLGSYFYGSNNNAGGNNLVYENKTNNTGADSDGDGLKDWEEGLWGSNPNLADSDKDGTPDGEEIRLKRNPALAGPNDALPGINPSLNEAQTKNETATSSENLTEFVSRQFLANYLASKNFGDGTTDKEAISDLLLENLQKQVYSDKYSKADVKFSAEGEANKKTYLNAAGGVLKKNFDKLDGNELQIMISVLKSDDMEELKNLEGFRKAYAASIAELASLKPTPDLIDLHTELLNILANSDRAVLDMQKIESDPFKALVGISEYLNGMGRMQGFLVSMNKKMNTDSIIFSYRDPGYAFVDYYAQAKAAGYIQ